MADMDKYIVEKYIDFDIIESYKKPISRILDHTLHECDNKPLH
jgi:hypothetical protein